MEFRLAVEQVPLVLFFHCFLILNCVTGVEILSKSKLERCEKVSDSDKLNCTKKILVDMAVPSGTGGGEASIVAEIVEVEENTTQKMHTVRIPPVLTINKSVAYALYEITYIQDVPYKPVEYYVQTRKCEPDADARVVKICESIRSYGLDSVIVVAESWSLLKGGPGQPQNLGSNFSVWMLLERVRFTLDGLECNKIGVSYEAYNGQPNFCSSPFWSCLHNQLWNYWEADQNRIGRNQVPLFGVEGRFERINQHPNAGTHSFSIGITEALNTNLFVELRADDIEYVYQRSPGKILDVTIPTFEALTQFGTATITTKNTGKLEASYSLTFDCSGGVTLMEEQFYIMKPDEVAVRSFKLYPTTDQAAKYVCAAILKDSDFSEVDRAECQFTTTATVLDNGSQISPFELPKTGINGFFESIEVIWNRFWGGLGDFFSGRTCRRKCSGFFDFSCHIQYICMSWVMMFGLFLAIFPTVIVLLWLLHQKGFFDPIYDWWDDQFEVGKHRAGVDMNYVTNTHSHLLKQHKKEGKNYNVQNKRSSHVRRELHKQSHPDFGTDYHHLRHAHKDRHKLDRGNNLGIMNQGYSKRKCGGHYPRGKGDGSMEEKLGHRRHKERNGRL